MNITTKIIIIDTNIITDLNIANILDKFVILYNLYISDMIKNDEINSATCNVEMINQLKVIVSTPKQIAEIFKISKDNKALSPYDIINYIIARDTNAIVATGDKQLKYFCEKNDIEVIRTLKIIKLLHENKLISINELIVACNNLKDNNSTRIPAEEIDKMLNEFEHKLFCR